MSQNLSANVETDWGLKFTITSTDGNPITEERINLFLDELEAKSITELSAGAPYPTKRVLVKTPTVSPYGQSGFVSEEYEKVPATSLSKKEWYDQFYKDKLTKILRVPEDKIDLDNGLSTDIPRAKPLPSWARAAVANPYMDTGTLSLGARTGISDRSVYSFLQTVPEQIAFLGKKFGDENVKHFRSDGKDLILFREDANSAWKFPEGNNMIEVADFVQDLAGETIPTAASVVSGIVGLTGGPLMSAVAGGAAYGVTGAAQDYLVQKNILGEADLPEIASRRSKQAALMAVTDYAMMQVPKAFMWGFMGKEGTDLFAQSMKDFVKIADNSSNIPRAPWMNQGLEIANRAKEIELKFPEGAIARANNAYRSSAGENFQQAFNPSGNTQEAAERGLREGMEHINASLQDSRNKLLARLDEINQQKAASKSASERNALKKARKEAIDAFNAQIARYQDDVLPSVNVSPSVGGSVAQQKLASEFVDTSIVKSRNFEEAYELLRDLSIPIDDFNQVLGKSSKELITDINDESVAIINANARNTANTAIKRLDELAEAGGQLDFRSLTEIIQKLQEKSKRGQFVVGFDANQYRQLTDDLVALRDKMLQNPSANPQGVAQYEHANQFFRDEYLPYFDVEKLFSAKTGQGYADVMAARSSGAGAPLPDFDLESDVVLDNILKNSGTVEEFLSLSKAGDEVKNILRNYWLQKKGLVAGRPINPSKVTNMSEADFDVIRALWPEGQKAGQRKTGEAGWNAKVEVFRDLQQLIGEKDDLVADVSSRTFEKLMNASTKEANESAARIAKEEILVNRKLKEQSMSMVKMANEGKLPLPKNRVQIKTFLSGLKASTPAEQDKFISLLKQSNPSMIDDLQGALFYDLVRISNSKGIQGGTSAASPAKNILWDPSEMAKQLESNMQLITSIIGREGYDRLVKTNTVLLNISRPMDGEVAQKGARASVNVGASGARGWIGNVTAPVTDRFASIIMSAQANSPIPIKYIVSAESYDKLQTALLRGTLLSAKGLALTNSEAEESPEFNAFLTANLAELRESIRDQRESIQEQNKQQPTQMPVQ
jgi:hypothetical protein